MATTLNKLSAVSIPRIDQAGRYSDGGGLYLAVTRTNKGFARSWVFRFTAPSGRIREMGIGSVNDVPLQEARKAAAEARLKLTKQQDPLDERRNRLNAVRIKKEKKRIAFKDAATKLIQSKRHEWKNRGKHEKQWWSSLEMHARPIWSMDVADIDDGHILKVLEPIWTTKTETASRVRQRVEVILDWAKAHKYRDGDNPARWKGHLDKLGLSKVSTIKKVEHFKAMPYRELPAFMRLLRSREGIGARALEFLILTCSRTNEVRFAEWHEIDMREKLWSIPADKMKMKKPHIVPLSDAAVALLKKLPRVHGCSYVFPGVIDGKPMSSMTMLELLRGMRGDLTVHGFRSTFRDWAAEKTNTPRDIVELALAHRIESATELSYKRTDLRAKRRKLAQAWAAFCESK